MRLFCYPKYGFERPHTKESTRKLTLLLFFVLKNSKVFSYSLRRVVRVPSPMLMRGFYLHHCSYTSELFKRRP